MVVEQSSPFDLSQKIADAEKALDSKRLLRLYTALTKCRAVSHYSGLSDADTAEWVAATGEALRRMGKPSPGAPRIPRRRSSTAAPPDLSALDQSDLFSDLSRWPRRPYCTDDFEEGLRIRSLKQALTKCYIQANPPHLRVWSIYDIDRPGGGLAWEDANLPPPSWATVNKANGHAHLVYGLRAPVLTASMEARQAPLRYLNAVEAAFRAKLNGDDGYSGLITKNPSHPLWRTLRGPALAYELGDLAEWVDLDRFKARQGVKVAEVGLGRNVTVFDFVRLWAYKKVREYRGQQGGFVHWQKAVYDRCLARNADFSKPMDPREAYQISKSVAKWVWLRFDTTGSDERFSMLQAFRSAKGLKVRREKSFGERING